MSIQFSLPHVVKTTATVYVWNFWSSFLYLHYCGSIMVNFALVATITQQHHHHHHNHHHHHPFPSYWKWAGHFCKTSSRLEIVRNISKAVNKSQSTCWTWREGKVNLGGEIWLTRYETKIITTMFKTDSSERRGLRKGDVCVGRRGLPITRLFRICRFFLAWLN